MLTLIAVLTTFPATCTGLETFKPKLAGLDHWGIKYQLPLSALPAYFSIGFLAALATYFLSFSLAPVPPKYHWNACTLLMDFHNSALHRAMPQPAPLGENLNLTVAVQEYNQLLSINHNASFKYPFKANMLSMLLSPFSNQPNAIQHLIPLPRKCFYDASQTLTWWSARYIKDELSQLHVGVSAETKWKRLPTVPNINAVEKKIVYALISAKFPNVKWFSSCIAVSCIYSSRKPTIRYIPGHRLSVQYRNPSSRNSSRAKFRTHPSCRITRLSFGAVLPAAPGRFCFVVKAKRLQDFSRAFDPVNQLYQPII